MTIGEKIFRFLGESNTFFQLLDYMFENITRNISRYDDDWSWRNFDMECFAYSEHINFEWDFSAFLFFMRALNHEISTNGIHEDCRTWPFTFVIERLWDTITPEPKPDGLGPEGYVEWAETKGYL